MHVGKRLTKSKMGVLTSVSINQTEWSFSLNHIREARLVGESTWLGDKHARSHRLLAYQRDEKARGLPRTQDTGGAPPVAPSPHSLADVFRVQLFPAGLALKTAQMPVFVQSHQGLAVFDFCAAAPTTWKKDENTDINCGPRADGVWAAGCADATKAVRVGPGQPQSTIQLHASAGPLHNGRCERVGDEPGGSFLQVLSTDCTQPSWGDALPRFQEVSLGLSSSCGLGAPKLSTLWLS